MALKQYDKRMHAIKIGCRDIKRNLFDPYYTTIDNKAIEMIVTYDLFRWDKQ